MQEKSRKPTIRGQKSTIRGQIHTSAFFCSMIPPRTEINEKSLRVFLHSGV